MGERGAREPYIAFHCARCDDDFAVDLAGMRSGRVVLCPVCLGAELSLGGEWRPEVRTGWERAQEAEAPR